MAEAEKHARVAMEGGPGMARAHELLGALRLNRRDLEGAMSELQTAIKLETNFAKAQYELRVVLYIRGDLTGAVEHLKLASQGGDPDAATAE
jgi:Flp pilus assembly protein TadD